MRMPDCELLSTCPFFNDSSYAIAEIHKEQYCKERYPWCGRYLIFRALQGELERTSSFRSHQDGTEEPDVLSYGKGL